MFILLILAKCGVGLLDIRQRDFYQFDLFCAGQKANTDKLMKSLDITNQRYGRGTLTFGAEGITGKWTMN